MRLPTHITVSGLIRQVQAEGGFATVVAKGERDAGTLVLILTNRGSLSIAYEIAPQADGTRGWSQAKAETADDPAAFGEYLNRRRHQDPDLWIVELDVENPERFIAGPIES